MSEERLREYIENDKIYQEYKKREKRLNDFERFCFIHCEDIENVLNELETLRKRRDKQDTLIEENTRVSKNLYKENIRLSIILSQVKAKLKFERKASVALEEKYAVSLIDRINNIIGEIK
jgi:hypothetical protein